MGTRLIKYTLDVDKDSIVQDAVDIFHTGFACSESVIYALGKHFELEISDDAIAMSSGFPWGIGGGGCLCGALAGGTMMLGYFFGRTKPGDIQNLECFEVCKVLHDAFCLKFGACCCSSLTRDMEKDAPDRKAQCTQFVAFAVEKTAEIILDRSGK